MSDSGRTMRFLCKPCGHWYEEYLTELHVARAHGRIHELQQALASANSVAEIRYDQIMKNNEDAREIVSALEAELAERTAERDVITKLSEGVCRQLDTTRAGTAAQTREWEKAIRAEMDNGDRWQDEYENLITVANSLEAERDAARAWSRRWKRLAWKRDAEYAELCGLERHANALAVHPGAVRKERQET